MEQLINSLEDQMNKSCEAFKNELKKVRTGKAHASMLDPVKVDYYGNVTPLNQVASISCPDPKSFVISPWDTNALKAIEEAIINSNIGMAPQNDGKIIRLKVPELTQERRQEMVKMIKKMSEDAKVSVRMARRNSNEEIKQKTKDKEMSEDDQKKCLDKVQKVTNSFIDQIDSIVTKKEAELLSI